MGRSLPKQGKTHSKSHSEPRAKQINKQLCIRLYNSAISEYDYNENKVKVYTLNESKLHKCPHVKLSIKEQKVIGILDTGAEATLMSEHLFESLTNRAVKFLSIPVVNRVLHSAFGKKSKRIKTQALVEFKVRSEIYEQVALIAPDLVVDMLLGVDFFDEYKIHIDFRSKSFETRVGGVAT
jgi:hypothetical protein